MLPSQTLNTSWVRQDSEGHSGFFCPNKNLLNSLKERGISLRPRTWEVTDPSLDRAKWKELGLEGTSRMVRSHEDKRVQLRRNKVSFPALTFEVSFFCYSESRRMHLLSNRVLKLWETVLSQGGDKRKKKKLGNFECPNISPDPISRATLPPQSKTWNSKYLTEHNHHVPQTQHALIAPSRTFSDHVCMNTEDLCSTEASSVCFYSELMNVQVGAASAAAEEPGTSSKAVDGVGRNWLLSGPDYIKILQI